MPGGDRTGPGGAGPRTGRAAGFCAGFGLPGYANPIGGRGFGFGMGYGRGFGRGMGRGFRGGGRGWFGSSAPSWTGAPYMQSYDYPNYPYEPATNEIEDLKLQEKYYSKALKELQNRIESLESKLSPQSEE